MSKIKIIALLVAISTFIFACSDSKTKKTSNVQPEVKKGVKPIADNEIAIIELENSAAYGTIKLELYSNIAPKHVARFKELAKEGFYNGIAFHRVNQSIIQAGDPLSKDDDPNNDGSGNSTKPNVDAEFSDIPYDTGILGAARTPEFNTANSQFFITLKRVPDFDNRYTVFGKVIEGMNNAQTISGAPTDQNNPRGKERPLENIRIKSITIQAK